MLTAKITTDYLPFYQYIAIFAADLAIVKLTTGLGIVGKHKCKNSEQNLFISNFI